MPFITSIGRCSSSVLNLPFFNVLWCNGSTRGFGSLSHRSNRCRTTVYGSSMVSVKCILFGCGNTHFFPVNKTVIHTMLLLVVKLVGVFFVFLYVSYVFQLIIKKDVNEDHTSFTFNDKLYNNLILDLSKSNLICLQIIS